MMVHYRLWLADSTTNESKRKIGLLMARGKKKILIFILALNEQKFNLIHWGKNELQDRLEYLKSVLHSACLPKQTI